MSKLIIFICVWSISLVLSMYITAINKKVVYVRDFLYGCLFGPLYLLVCIDGLDTVLWERKKNET
jgi:hypothetical protein